VSRRQVTQAEVEAARAHLAAVVIPCPACDNPQAGPLHRTSARLWQGRADRARENGTDPVSGVTLAEAERHLAAIGDEEKQ
jgi:hypothetical protein